MVGLYADDPVVQSTGVVVVFENMLILIELACRNTEHLVRKLRQREEKMLMHACMLVERRHASLTGACPYQLLLCT